MEENVENFGKVTFKVKLLDAYHDFVLEWSEESQSYEGKQLFKQLASITRIPEKCTIALEIYGGRHPCPASYILVCNPESEFYKDYKDTITNQHLVCNKLVKEVVRCKNQLNCDRFILIFRMDFSADELFFIYYELITPLAVPETECRRDSKVCHSKNTKVSLDKIRSIITNDELHSQIKDLFSSYSDDAQHANGWNKVLTHFNVRQYLYVPCNRITYSRQDHLYLRTRG